MRYTIGDFSFFLTTDQLRTIPIIVILIVVAVIVYNVFSLIDKRSCQRKKDKTPVAAATAPEEAPEQAPAPEVVPEPAPEPAEETPEIRVPERINGAPLAYHYDEVAVEAFDDSVFSADWLDARAPISMQLASDRGARSVLLLMSGHPFAYLENTKLADMAIDWINRNDPYFVALRFLTFTEKKISVFLGFYRKRTTANAKEYKLVSNKNSEMQAYILCCSDGDECELDFDFEKDKYLVSCNGLEIGYLPKSAGSLVDEVGADEVAVFISAIDLDDDGRSLVSVSVEY